MNWYRFIANKNEAFIIDTQYLPQMHTFNSHLYMRDGYTWIIYQKQIDDIVIYYLKSDHIGFSTSLLNKLPNPEYLLQEPDITGFICYYGGSNGVNMRNY